MATTHFLEYVTYFYNEVEACIVTYLLLVKPKHFCFDAHSDLSTWTSASYDEP